MKKGQESSWPTSCAFHPDDDPTGRRSAYELPPGIKTMIGQRRLGHLRGCVEDVVANMVPGDLSRPVSGAGPRS